MPMTAAMLREVSGQGAGPLAGRQRSGRPRRRVTRRHRRRPRRRRPGGSGRTGRRRGDQCHRPQHRRRGRTITGKRSTTLSSKKTPSSRPGRRGCIRTSRPGQRRVRVGILQGEARQAEACIRIGECWIDGLPPDLPPAPGRSPLRLRGQRSRRGARDRSDDGPGRSGGDPPNRRADRGRDRARGRLGAGTANPMIRAPFLPAARTRERP